MKRKILMAGIMILSLVGIVFAVSFTPQGNIDLKDYYNITNLAYVDGFTLLGNIIMNNYNLTGLTKLSATLVDTTNLEADNLESNLDGTGYDITANEFKGNLNWTYLQNYPTACPAGSYLTQLDDSVTCTTPSEFLLLTGGNMTGSIGNLSQSFISNGEDLVSYWALDSGEGSIAYDSQGDNDGTIYGDTNGSIAQFVSGKFGNALSFDGIDDYVKVPDDDSLRFENSSFTILGWVHIPGDWDEVASIYPLTKRYTSIRGSYLIRIRNTNETRFLIFNGSSYYGFYSSNMPTLTKGKWYFVCMKYDYSSGIMYAYIFGDGYSYTGESNIGQISISYSTGPLYIGNNYYNGIDGAGSIQDEVRIYNRSLTSQEIQAEYLLGVSSHSPNGHKVSKTGGTMSGTLNTGKYLNVTSSDYGSCSASKEGFIVYNSTAKHFYGCNSTSWNELG